MPASLYLTVGFRRIIAIEDSDPADAFDAKIADLIGRYRDGRTPDFPTASLASMFAWSLAMLPLHAAPRAGRRRC